MREKADWISKPVSGPQKMLVPPGKLMKKRLVPTHFTVGEATVCWDARKTGGVTDFPGAILSVAGSDPPVNHPSC